MRPRKCSRQQTRSPDQRKRSSSASWPDPEASDQKENCSILYLMLRSQNACDVLNTANAFKNQGSAWVVHEPTVGRVLV